MSIGSTKAESGVRRFSRHVALTLIVKVVIAASSLLSGIIVARSLGAGGVGVVAALSVTTMLAVTFGGLGAPSAVTFLVARDRTSVKPVLANSLIFSLVAGVILAGALILLAARRPSLLGDVPPRLLIVAVLALPIQLLAYIVLAVLLGLQRIRQYNVADLALQLVIPVNAVLTLVVLRLGLNELIIAGTVLNVLVGVAITVFMFRNAPDVGVLRPDGEMFKNMLDYGSRFFVALTASTVILRGDLLLVNYFRGSSEAGVYGVATQVATLLQMAPAVISTILFPRTAAAKDTSGSITSRVTRHTALIMLLLCIAAAPASFVLPLIYGSAFASVPLLFIIMLPGVYLLGLETVQVQHFTGGGLPALVPMFWVVTMLVCIGSDIILIPKYGASAAAAVSSVCYGLIFILVAALFRRRTGQGFRESFIIRRGELRSLLLPGRQPAASTAGGHE